jgi:hypothetical protein
VPFIRNLLRDRAQAGGSSREEPAPSFASPGEGQARRSEILDHLADALGIFGLTVALSRTALASPNPQLSLMNAPEAAARAPVRALFACSRCVDDGYRDANDHGFRPVISTAKTRPHRGFCG